MMLLLVVLWVVLWVLLTCCFGWCAFDVRVSGSDLSFFVSCVEVVRKLYGSCTQVRKIRAKITRTTSIQLPYNFHATYNVDEL